MVAYKNNPGQGEEKIHQKHDYRSSSSVPGSQYNHNRPFNGDSARQKDIPVSDESLDHLIQPPATNEFYQHAPKTHGKRIPSGINPEEFVSSGYVTHQTRQRKNYPTGLGNAYDLSQPIWFYMIMKKLAAEKEKKK